MSPLVLGEILGVFVNTLSADHKYPSQDCENLLLPIQMQLSGKKKKLFLEFFLHFWNVHQILSILKERMLVIANIFPKIQTVKMFIRPLSKKRCYRRRFVSQHVITPQILMKSP